ncbi:4Fe-4S ferredoxin iron-sulfur binding domain protein [Methanothermus fervidus DSM 2088]|uniref:4Fe-4S ferredoxin iron-sulfur binding domain protein n=1 Tax=Methanothermus fervidus (strain ATCC 43054 / DSM 2088 / JCM 10308 / V24 S) TaxID=523846 RepID=E3GWT8_METFV|nr:4Fe-4S binding protein [Methanothermus fervidus]ADP78007.1 4Fe-4S ferredoxin iron-sulfur binding domain protein [Methanothermus fervidus DSM 2088]
MKVCEWCMYCGECAGVCPNNAIEVCESSLRFDKKKCNECEFCIKVCPINALSR